MKNFFAWFTEQWRIKSDWVSFTYGIFGVFTALEILSQIIYWPTFPTFLVAATSFYILIACPLGYFTRNNP